MLLAVTAGDVGSVVETQSRDRESSPRRKMWIIGPQDRGKNWRWRHLTDYRGSRTLNDAVL